MSQHSIWDTFSFSIDPNVDSFWLQYVLKNVPGDGHCFMHALSVSLQYQHDMSFSTGDLLNVLRDECNRNRYIYFDFLTHSSRQVFESEMNQYIYSRVYNTWFGDLLPRIMSKALNINVCIIELSGDHYIKHNICHDDNNDDHPDECVVFVYKGGDHYDAIIPKDNPNIINIATCLLSNTPSNGRLSAVVLDGQKAQCGNPKSKQQYSTSSNNDKNLLRKSDKKSRSVHNEFIKKVNKHTGLKVAHLNIRSLFNKFEEIKHILCKSQLDILCLTETWLDNTITDNELYINGYKIERRDRNRTGGGVMMYIKEHLNYNLRKDISIIQPNIENIWIQIDWKKKSKSPFLISCIYRPPSSNVEYYNGILDMIEKASFEDKHIFILGDLNYDYTINESLCNNPLHYIENLYGLSQLITKPTRVTNKSSTLIDVILSSKPEYHHCTDVFRFSLSDHFMIYTCIDAPLQHKKHKEVTFRCYRDFSEAAFLNELSSSSLNGICFNSTDDVTSAWQMWKETFLDICDKHAPIRSMRMKDRFNPWVTPAIVKSMYARDHKHMKATKSGNPRDWSEYKISRNTVTSLINQEKKKYFENVGTNFEKKPKKFWKEMGKLLGNKKQDNPIPSTLSGEQFNKYFTTIGSELQKTLPDPGPLVWKNPKCIYSFQFKQIEEKSVLKQLKRLSYDSHLDVLKLDTKLLRIGASLLSPSLTCLMNMSMQQGVVPDEWKLAKVTPIYKGKGDKNKECNYRPISVIASISMMMEREVHTQIFEYFIQHDLITLDQFAFLKHHSTVTCLHRMLDDWYDAINNNEIIVSCFFDIQKCFDSISHKILLQKLSLHGVNGKELNWFTNYLTNRKQRVKCNNQICEPLAISTGVPQGSALGPFLFLVFINDFPQHIRHSLSNLFADDGTLYTTGKTIRETESKMQQSVNDASKWYDNNNIPLNIPKTSCMLSGSESLLNRIDENEKVLNLYLKDEKLYQVSKCPYLGMQVDNNLKLSQHVQHLCKTLSAKVAVLGRIRKVLNSFVLKKIYMACIQPVFDYAISLWGHCSEYDKSLITRVQHRAARIITGQFDYVTVRGHDLVTHLRLQSIEMRRDYFTACLMYKCLNSIAPLHLINEISLVSEIHDVNTRSAQLKNVHVPMPNSELFKKSFRYHGAIIWNSLPAELKQAGNIEDFKYRYKQKYFN